MRLTVFGATGKTGRQVMEQALAAGHEVTAAVRTPAGVELRHERLRVVRCDVMEAAEVAAAVDGADAVISTVGSTSTSAPDLMTVFAGHLVAGMRAHEVERVVSLLGAGVADPRDEGSLGRTLMRGVMKLVVRRMLEDSQGHAEILRSSGLRWTIARPPRLTDGPRRGSYRKGYLRLGPRESISRADLASFLLHCASTDDFAGEAPMVSY